MNIIPHVASSWSSHEWAWIILISLLISANSANYSLELHVKIISTFILSKMQREVFREWFSHILILISWRWEEMSWSTSSGVRGHVNISKELGRVVIRVSSCLIFDMRTGSRIGKCQGGDSVVERTVLRTMLAVISTGKMVVIRGSTCLKSP